MRGLNWLLGLFGWRLVRVVKLPTGGCIKQRPE